MTIKGKQNLKTGLILGGCAVAYYLCELYQAYRLEKLRKENPSEYNRKLRNEKYLNKNDDFWRTRSYVDKDGNYTGELDKSDDF